jgi:hypothetical protein
MRPMSHGLIKFSIFGVSPFDGESNFPAMAKANEISGILGA